MPFAQVATAEHGRGYDTIRRTNRHRAVAVTADVDLTRADPHAIIADLDAQVLPAQLADYPAIRYSFEGSSSRSGKRLAG